MSRYGVVVDAMVAEVGCVVVERNMYRIAKTKGELWCASCTNFISPEEALTCLIIDLFNETDEKMMCCKKSSKCSLQYKNQTPIDSSDNSMHAKTP